MNCWFRGKIAEFLLCYGKYSISILLTYLEFFLKDQGSGVTEMSLMWEHKILFLHFLITEKGVFFFFYIHSWKIGCSVANWAFQSCRIAGLMFSSSWISNAQILPKLRDSWVPNSFQPLGSFSPWVIAELMETQKHRLFSSPSGHRDLIFVMWQALSRSGRELLDRPCIQQYWAWILE